MPSDGENYFLNIPEGFPEETDGEQDNTGDIPSSTE
jgi:hypothetical protein